MIRYFYFYATFLHKYKFFLKKNLNCVKKYLYASIHPDHTGLVFIARLYFLGVWSQNWETAGQCHQVLISICYRRFKSTKKINKWIYIKAVEHHSNSIISDWGYTYSKANNVFYIKTLFLHEILILLNPNIPQSFSGLSLFT